VAFDADYRSEPLEHFEPLVRELLVIDTADAGQLISESSPE
jgi:hypothetical protein